MPIEKELLEYLGIDNEKAKDLEGFKSEFEGKYIQAEKLTDTTSPEFKKAMPAFFGHFAGKNESKIRLALKEHGVELTGEEMKQGYEYLASAGMSKIADKYKTELAEKDLLLSKNKDEVAKDYEEKLNKTKQKLTDTEKLLQETSGKFEAMQSENDSTIKKIKLDVKEANLYAGIEWANGVDELKKKGFLAKWKENYKPDLDETGELEIFNIKGEKLPNKAKNGTFLKPSEALKQFAIEEKVWSESPQNNRTGIFNINSGQKTQSDNPIQGNRTRATRRG